LSAAADQTLRRAMLNIWLIAR